MTNVTQKRTHGSLFDAGKQLKPILTTLTAGFALGAGATATENVTNLVSRLDPLTAGVISNYLLLTDIPRPTDGEKAVSDALVAWAKARGFTPNQDNQNNVWFDVPATTELKSLPLTILQGHMDMVAVGFADSMTESVLVDCDADGTLHSSDKKTSIGADDGIGVAMAMAVAEGLVPHGPVRVLITTDEEGAQKGAQSLNPSVLTAATHLINVDSETDGEATISAAACDIMTVTGAVTAAAATGNDTCRLEIAGFRGGHSGVDIDLGRLNAIVELGRLLTNAAAQGISFELSEMKGGDADNAIPPHAAAVVRIASASRSALEALLSAAEQTYRNRGETGATVALTATNGFADVFSETAKTHLLGYLTDVPVGVWNRSTVVPGLVETSFNLGGIHATTNGVKVTGSSRGSVHATLAAEEAALQQVAEAHGYAFSIRRICAPWPADVTNPLIAVMTNAWREVSGGEMKLVSVHAGLECGWFATMAPMLNIVSIGPTVNDAHTRSESFTVSAVSNSIRLVARALATLPPREPEPIIPPAVTNGAVVVLSTNDSHGHVDDGAIRFSQIAALKEQLEREGKAVLLLDAGDFMQGTTAASIDQGRSLVQIVKATGYDLVTLGNHEFDYTAGQLLTTLDEAGLPVACCDFFETNDVTRAVTRPFPDSKIFERGGLKIGVVGVDTPKTVSASLPVNFLDPTGTYFRFDFDGRLAADRFYERVQLAVDALAPVCDAVILLAHLGTEADHEPYRSADLIAHTTNVTAVIDGHSHVSMPGETMLNAIGKGVRVTQTAGMMQALGWMTLNDKGKVLDSGHLTALGATNATVYALETNLLESAQRMFGMTIAEVPFDYRSTSGVASNLIRIVRERETNLGDLAADAIYWEANQAGLGLSCDLVLLNGGGIRADLPTGEVTLKMLNEIMPFGNATVLIRTKGQTILDGLEWGAQCAGSGLFGGFLQTAGLYYEIATNAPFACQSSAGFWTGGPTNGIYRVRNVQVYDRSTASWLPLDLDRDYCVGGQSPLLQKSCDGASMWTNSTIVAADLGLDYQVFARYCAAFASGLSGQPELSAANSPLAQLSNYPLDYATTYGTSRIVRYAAAPDVPFPAAHVGVCSWSWATNLTTILEQMDAMGVNCMQLSLVPWVKPLYGIEYDASLRETFGQSESWDAFLMISNKIAKSEISVLSTMISFPFDRWGSYQTISNANGIVCNIATNDPVGEVVSTDDPLGLAAWTICSNLVDQAAAMSAQLGVKYISMGIGFLDKPMIDHGTNANENAAIGFERLFEVQRLCANHGIRLLIESGQYSAVETMALIGAYTNRYAPCAFDHGLTVNDIAISYDTANHLIYENDSSTNAFAVMKSRIPQIRVKDTFESRARREAAGNFAVDVQWGTADVSRKLDTIAFLKASGYKGHLLVEHKWGDDRFGDINAALKAILLANNDDPDDPWISPTAMTGVTAGARCEAALKAQGFSNTVAKRLANEQLYAAFRNWAEDNDQNPDDLVTKSGVILASAHDAPAVADPADISMSVTNLTVDTVSADATLSFEIVVAAETYDSAKINANLLKAALGVEGTADLASDLFSPDTLDFAFGEVTEGRLPVQVVPKKVQGMTPGKFFIRTKAE